MTSIQHNALLRQAKSMDAWWSAPLSNLAATWTNWFSDRLKKIKPAIKTSRKVLNGPYVHNKLSYVFFPSFSSGHPSYLHWQVTGHTNVTVMMTGLRPSCYVLNSGHILEYQEYTVFFPWVVSIQYLNRNNLWVTYLTYHLKHNQILVIYSMQVSVPHTNKQIPNI